MLRSTLTIFIGKILVKIIRDIGLPRVANEGIVPIAKPSSFFLVILMLSFLFPAIQLPPSTSFYVVQTMRAFLPLLATIV